MEQGQSTSSVKAFWGLIALSAFLASLISVNVSASELSASAIDDALASLPVQTEGAGVAQVSIYQSVDALYLANNGGFVWPEGDSFAAIVEAIQQAVFDHGLVAADYPFDELGVVTDRARADVLLSLSVAQFAQQVRYGRLDPLAISEILDYPVRTGDLARTIRFVAVGAPAGLSADRLNSLAPAHSQYRDLQQQLKAALAASDNMLPDGPLLRPGDVDPRLAVLHHRFDTYEPFIDGFRQSMTYDDRLEVAVKDFQARHGLDVDGVIGPMTQRVLNVSAEARVQQIQMNMERWRWMPETLGVEHIFVNIPTYHLDFMANGRLTHRMPGIVGRPERKTALFSSQLTWLEFNPTWTVPERIAELDILPAVIEDENYFVDRQIRMYSSWKQDAPQVSTRYIDWESMGKRIHRFRLRQDPGPQNPLGRVKFMMANNHSIFLHDTNERGLFDHDDRAFSAGCIRVEDPRWLAAYLMERPDFLDDSVENEYFSDSWETKRVSLRRPMPVHLAYFTVWKEDGAVQIRDDIYDFDARMLEAWNGADQRPVTLAALAN